MFRFDGEEAGVRLGSSVSSAGDIDGDGYLDILAGAPYANTASVSEAGSVFAFSGQTGLVIRRFDGSESDSMFGVSIDGGKDVDADGIPDVIVGALDHLLQPIGKVGAAFVFSSSNSNLLFQAFGPEKGNWFGYDVALVDDVDLDDHDNILIGAPSASPGGVLRSGSAFLFSSRLQEQLFQMDGLEAGDNVGVSVSGGGESTQNGGGEFVIGISGFDLPGITGAGAAVLLSYELMLETNRRTLSASSSSHIDFTIDFPNTEAGMNYQLLGSLTGAGPWVRNGVCIPLTYDSITERLLINPPAIFGQISGVLDSVGNAMASLDVAAGKLTGHEGTQMFLAVVSLSPSGIVRRSSARVILTVVP